MDPKADLEIKADEFPGTNRYNGIIIPKVAALPLSGEDTFPTLEQSGLLLFLDSTDSTRGIYIFTGSEYVKLEPASSTGAFYIRNTTDYAVNIDDNIQREGNVSIGSNLNSGRLNVQIEDTDALGTRTALRIRNDNRSEADFPTYGIFTENRSATINNKVGIRNRVTSSGIGSHIGIDNIILIGTPNNINYGIRSDLRVTRGVSSMNYGIYSTVGNDQSTGINYGVYSVSNNSGNQPSYSGYFRGDRFAIRNQEDNDGYEMPTVSGNAGEVLTTDGSGNATWENLSKSNIRSLSAGTVAINDDTIIASGNISIPAAQESNKGKTYIIALASNSTDVDVTTTGNGFLNPGDSTSSSIINLNTSAGETRCITIQSDGTHWFVLNRLAN